MDAIVYGNEIMEVSRLVLLDNLDKDDFQLLSESSVLDIESSSNMKKLFLVGVCNLAKTMKQTCMEDDHKSENIRNYFLQNLKTATWRTSVSTRYRIKCNDISENEKCHLVVSFFCVFDNQNDFHKVFSFNVA